MMEAAKKTEELEAEGYHVVAEWGVNEPIEEMSCTEYFGEYGTGYLMKWAIKYPHGYYRCAVFVK
jgi:hypothetical protein